MTRQADRGVHGEHVGTAGGVETRPALVSAHGIGVRRGDRWLIRGVDLAVHRGEIVTLIGPNGGGKSTAAKVILGIKTADEGSLASSPGLRVGYVPQRLTIEGTLPFTVRRLMTLTGQFPEFEIDKALAEVGIAHLAGAQARHLSSGEFQRALLARAIVRRPDLLVLDEPVQGVDFSGETALYELIATIRDRLDCGILLISHDLHLVMGATDTVICLNGHVCCSGPPHSVAADPAYRELFGPRTAQAFAVYRHDHDHAHLPDGRVVSLDRTEDPSRDPSGTARPRTGDA
ncbi:MAG: metal ABC transporter ATP-binding protein [Rhodospirillales bacterium]|nr:metal ABC transporter ATP-binding protein [Rhodospirillales bacterium]